MAEEQENEAVADLAYLENMADGLEPDSIRNSEESIEKDDEVKTEQLLVMFLNPVFDVVAPNWKITAEEKAALAAAYAPVIDKYFGGLAMGVEIQAIMITAMIIAPRVSVPRVSEKGDALSDKENKSE